MVEPLRHRLTKGAETRMLVLTPPRHIPTLPILIVGSASTTRRSWRQRSAGLNDEFLEPPQFPLMAHCGKSLIKHSMRPRPNCTRFHGGVGQSVSHLRPEQRLCRTIGFLEHVHADPIR